MVIINTTNTRNIFKKKCVCLLILSLTWDLLSASSTAQEKCTMSNDYMAFIQCRLRENQPEASLSGSPTQRSGSTAPTETPTEYPTALPSRTPTRRPTKSPTLRPTKMPTKAPTPRPTAEPSLNPTGRPTRNPTISPTHRLTEDPTFGPTSSPTSRPTGGPTLGPTRSPTQRPTQVPTHSPTRGQTINPTESPSFRPTKNPTPNPSAEPTQKPSVKSTTRPTSKPSRRASGAPTMAPMETYFPTLMSLGISAAASNDSPVEVNAISQRSRSPAAGVPTMTPYSNEVGAAPTSESRGGNGRAHATAMCPGYSNMYTNSSEMVINFRYEAEATVEPERSIADLISFIDEALLQLLAEDVLSCQRRTRYAIRRRNLAGALTGVIGMKAMPLDEVQGTCLPRLQPTHDCRVVNGYITLIYPFRDYPLGIEDDVRRTEALSSIQNTLQEKELLIPYGSNGDLQNVFLRYMDSEASTERIEMENGNGRGAVAGHKEPDSGPPTLQDNNRGNGWIAATTTSIAILLLAMALAYRRRLKKSRQLGGRGSTVQRIPTDIICGDGDLHPSAKATSTSRRKKRRWAVVSLDVSKMKRRRKRRPAVALDLQSPESATSADLEGGKIRRFEYPDWFHGKISEIESESANADWNISVSDLNSHRGDNRSVVEPYEYPHDLEFTFA